MEAQPFSLAPVLSFGGANTMCRTGSVQMVLGGQSQGGIEDPEGEIEEARGPWLIWKLVLKEGPGH